MRPFLTPLAVAVAAIAVGCNEPKPLPGRILKIVTEPAGAEVALNGKSIGQAPLETRVSGRAQAVTATLSGYEAAAQAVPASDPPRNATVTLRLRKRTALVMLDSTPTGAAVRIDDDAVGRTPVFLSGQPLGEYTVTFELAGYASKSMPLQLTDSRPRRLSAELGSILGGLTLYSQPGGCSIYIDGALRGTTPDNPQQPLQMRDLPEGEYTLVVRRAGHREISHQVLVKRNTNRTVRLPALEELPGTLEVNSVPDGATVYRGSAVIGKTPLTMRDLHSGTVSLRFELDGYEPVTRSVRIQPGVTRKTIGVLSRNVGSISLATEPPGCRIYLDEEDIGTTRRSENETVSAVFTHEGIKPGQHTVTIEQPRYHTVTRTIQVQRGQTTRLGIVKLKKRWLPDYELKLRKSGQVVRGILKQQRRDGSILFEHSPGIRIEYRKNEIEYLTPLELPEAP